MPDAIATTKAQREILVHSLCGGHPKRKVFRNYFCLSVGGGNEPDVARLIELGLMKRGHTINDGRMYYAFVTEAGAAEVGLELPKEAAS